MKVVNLTPHPISLIGAGGRGWTFQPTATAPAARCAVERRQVGTVDLAAEDGITVTVPLYETIFGEVVDLPEPVAGTAYVVSRPVAEAMAGRRADLLVVDDTVRDAAGWVVGCRAFARVPAPPPDPEVERLRVLARELVGSWAAAERRLIQELSGHIFDDERALVVEAAAIRREIGG